MSGNRDELPEPSFASPQEGTRRELNQRRPPESGPTSREVQQTEAQRVAEELGITRQGVGTTDRIRGGLDVFLRSTGVRQFGESVRDQFADEADFVSPGDVNPQIDAEDIASDPVVARGRRDDVAQRARQGTAEDARFIEPTDLRADVGRRGVNEVAVAEGRRDDVASRARQSLAADDPFAKPGDFGVDVTATGIESAGFTDRGARRRASRQFESETVLGDVNPGSDIVETGDGFGLAEQPQREIAAINFEQDTRLGDVNPSSDIVETSGGFALGEGPQREIAALEFEDSTALEDVDPFGDVTPADDGFGLDTEAQRRAAARNFEAELEQFGRGELDPSDDIRQVNDGFGLGRDPAREVAADRIDEQLEEFNVTADSIELEETDTGAFEGIFEVRR